jgi:hypothetical protein
MTKKSAKKCQNTKKTGKKWKNDLFGQNLVERFEKVIFSDFLGCRQKNPLFCHFLIKKWFNSRPTNIIFTGLKVTQKMTQKVTPTTDLLLNPRFDPLLKHTPRVGTRQVFLEIG